MGPPPLSRPRFKPSLYIFSRVIFIERNIMATIKIKCTVCGKNFISHTKNACYCSSDCRRIGRSRARKQWEEKTNYRELQRNKMKLRRKLEKQQPVTKKEPVLKVERVIPKKRSYEELIEYWENYRLNLLKSESVYKKPTHTVGGIDIHEEDFAEKVVRQLRG